MPRTSTKSLSERTPCPFCSKTFAEPNSVYAHVKKCHPGKKYSSSMSKHAKAHQAHTTPTPNPIADLDQELKDIAMQLATGEIDFEEFTSLRNGVEAKKKIAQKAWIKTMTYPESPTIDFSIFEGKYIEENDSYSYSVLDDWVLPQYDRLLPMVLNSDHDKVFQIVFNNNIRIEPNGCDPLDLDILLFKVTYMKEAKEITEDKLTLNQIWNWYCKIIESLCRLTINKDRINHIDFSQPPEKIETIIDKDQEKANKLLDLIEMTMAKKNAGQLNQIAKVLPKFNRCLKT